MRLPRAVTDCVGTIDLGGTNIAISSVKFYPRYALYTCLEIIGTQRKETETLRHKDTETERHTPRNVQTQTYGDTGSSS